MANPWAGTCAAYKSICQGFSTHPEFPDIYVKHFDSIDLANAGEHYELAIDRYLKLGAKTEYQILQEKKETKLWTDEDENQIKSLELNISLMQEKKGKASIESQLEEIDIIIKEYVDKLNPLLNKRYSLLLTSAEHLAEMASTDFVLSLSLFRDRELTVPYFSLEDIEHFTESETQKYVRLYRETVASLDHNMLRKTSINPRFFDFFKNASSAESYFGKSGKDLTRNQIILFDCAKYFHMLIGEVPDLTDEERLDPEKIERAVILTRNQKDEPKDNDLRNAYSKAKTFGK